MNNGFRLVFLRTFIGRAWWLLVLFLLATAATVKAVDYTYTINPNGTIRIDGYTGLGGAITIPSPMAALPSWIPYRLFSQYQSPSQTTVIY